MVLIFKPILKYLQGFNCYDSDTVQSRLQIRKIDQPCETDVWHGGEHYRVAFCVPLMNFIAWTKPTLGFIRKEYW